MCKCANVQVCKCESVQMCKCEECKCANVQVCKCASMQECQPMQSLNVSRFFSVSTRLMAIGLVFSQDSVSSCRAITTLLIIIVLLFSALYLQTLSWWLHLKTLRVWSGESHSVECLWQISLSCLIFMKPCRALGHLAILWTYASPVLVRPLSVTVHDCICGYAILELILYHPYTFLSSHTIIPFL